MRKNQAKGSALTKVIGDDKSKKTGSSEEHCHEGQCRPFKSLDEELYVEATRMFNKNEFKSPKELHEKLKNWTEEQVKQYPSLKEKHPQFSLDGDQLNRNIRKFADAYTDFAVGAKAANQPLGYNLGRKDSSRLGYEDFQLQKQKSSDEGFGEKFNDITQTGEEKGDSGKINQLPLKKAVTLPSETPNPEIVTTQKPTVDENIGNGQTLVKSMEPVNNNQNNDYQSINTLPRKKAETISGGFTEIPKAETPISRALYNNIMSNKNASWADAEDAAEIARRADELQATVNREIDNAQLENNAPEGTQIVTNPDGTQSSVPPKQEQPVGNAMSKISQVVAGGSNEKPSYINTTNTTDVGNVVVDKDNYYNNMRSQVDPLVVEQLGVQDYYPDISRNIGVGTFSGKRIGSQTVYAGGGVLLPMGLYDARLRALDKKAKEKQAAIDKLKEIPDVPAQFQSEYSQNFMNTVNSYVDTYKGNYDALKKDRNFQKEMQRLKDLGKELNYTDKYIDGIIDKATNNKGWVPKGMLEKSYQFKSALNDDTPDILSGKKSVTPLVNQIRSYEDGTKWADDFAKQNFTSDKMGQTPLVFNQKSIKNPEDVKEYSEFLNAFKTVGGRDYDKIISGLRKFYDTKAIDDAVDAAYNAKNLDPATKEDITAYLLAQVPQDKIEMKQDIVQNENFERYQEANKNFFKQKEFDLKEKQGITHFNATNEIMNTAGVDGKTLNQKIADINATKGLSAGQKRIKMEQAFSSFGMEGNWDKATRTYVFKEKVSPEMQSVRHPTQPNEIMMKVKEPFKQKNGKTIWIEKSMPLNVVLEKKPGYLKTLDGTVLGKEELDNWRKAAKNNQITIGFTESEKAKGFSRGGKKAEVVTPENMQYFNDANSRNLVMFKGNAAGIVDAETAGADGKPVVSPLVGNVYVVTEISNLPGQQSADAIYGYNVNKKELSNAGERTMSGSSTAQSE